MKSLSLLLCFLVALLILAGCTSSQKNTVSNSGGPSDFRVTDTLGGTNFTAGQDIIITGSGFGDSRSAKKGGKSLVSFIPQSSTNSPVTPAVYPNWSNTSIRCTLPVVGIVTGSYQVQVNVVNASTGITTITSPFSIRITTTDIPTISSIVPLTVNQGGNITLFGDNFGAEVDDEYESAQAGGYVQFWTAPNYTSYIRQDTASIWTKTMVICQVPYSVPTGHANVAIVPGTSQSSLSVIYSINVVGPTDPTISTILPAIIDVGASTPITITGTNFGNSPGTVSFQSESGPQVSISSVPSWTNTKIICPMPQAITAAEGTVRVNVLSAGGNSTNDYNILVNTVGPLLHGPRLGLVTQTEATVSWDTRDSETGEVRWGTTTAYTGSQKENAPTTAHRLTITGLSPQMTYHYTVVAGGKPATDHTVTTAPLAGTDTFMFASLADNRGHSDQSDLQSISPGFFNILNQVKKVNPSFVLHGGDIFYGNTQSAVVEQLYDTFKTGTDPLWGDIPMLISPGNHEMQGLTDPQGKAIDPLLLFNQEFAQPVQLAGYEGTTYSFDWGNSHIVSVDSCHYNRSHPYGGMAYMSDDVIAWLDNDLKNAQDRKVRHIFVFSHVNAFSKYKLYDMGNVDPAQSRKFWDVLEKYNVDVYICGHHHLFDDQQGKGSVVQWLNGNSGSLMPGEGPNQYTIWRVNGDTVVAELRNETGELAYTRTIKSSQPK